MHMEALLLNTNATTIDKTALANLYESHSPGIFRYAYRLVGDTNLAEDCVAETFSRFIQAVWHGKGPEENAKAYLYRIAHNWITDYYRRQPLPSIELNENMHVDPFGDPIREYTQVQNRERLRAALLRLSPEQRQVIQLRFLEEWSYEQVAAALGKNIDATRALQHRALAALRRLLLEQEERYDEPSI